MLSRNLYDYKLQNVAPQCKFHVGLALIPLLTDPDGVRTAPGSTRTAFMMLTS